VTGADGAGAFALVRINLANTVTSGAVYRR